MSVADSGEVNTGLANELQERIAALGRLGLSPLVVHELHEMFVYDGDQDNAAQGLALGGFTLLLASREIGAIANREPSASDVIPFHRVDAITKGADISSMDSSLRQQEVLATEVVTINAPNVTVTDLETSTISRKARAFFESMLGEGTVPADLTMTQGATLLRLLSEKHALVRRTYGDNHTHLTQQRVLELFIQGKSGPEIAHEIPGITAANASNLRAEFRNRMQKHYDSVALLPLLTEVLKPAEAADVRHQSEQTQAQPTPALMSQRLTKAVAATLPKQIEVTETVPEQVQDDWRGTIEKLVASVWHAEDVQGLVELLDNQKGDKVDRARSHLQELLASYAPLKPTSNNRDATKLSPLEWETMNHISGFNLQQSLQPAQPQYILGRLGKAYTKQQVTFEEVFESALESLLQLAAKDYATGWYPGAQHSGTSPDETTAPKVDMSEVILDDIGRNISISIRRLMGNSLKLNNDQVQTLINHMSGQSTSIGGENLLRLTSVLKTKIHAAHASAMQTRNNGGNAHTITSVQNELLTQLLGSVSPYKEPKTINELAMLLNAGADEKVDTTRLMSEVGKALRTLARH